MGEIIQKNSTNNWFGNPEDFEPDCPIKSKPRIPFKKEPLDFTQSKFTPIHIFQYLPKDHDCYAFVDIFKQLDYTPLLTNYSPFGQHAYNPELIGNILLYAYCHGVYSSRQIERKCHTDLGFIYISQMNCPNFRVLSDFRKDNYDFFKKLFTQTVAIASELGLISYENVSLDGSKFKASTSKHKAMSYGRMEKSIKELRNIIQDLMEKIDAIEANENNMEIPEDYFVLKEELQFKENRLNKILEAKKKLEEREEDLHPGEQIPEKAQISFADTDARIMGKNGNFDYCYNGQICVDGKDQIIISQHLSQNANDQKEITPALLGILWNTGRLPDAMTFDNGYFSGFNLEALSNYGVNAFVAVGRVDKEIIPNTGEIERIFVKSEFFYSEEDDTFTCPMGNKLYMKYKDKDGKKTYSGKKEDCINCNCRSMCSKSKRGQPRTITTDDYEPLRNEMREKMRSEKAKAIYAKRKTIVEPVFGQIKNAGFRGFHLRGIKKTEGEFALICGAHNIKKIVKHITIVKSSLYCQVILSLQRVLSTTKSVFDMVRNIGIYQMGRLTIFSFSF